MREPTMSRDGIKRFTMAVNFRLDREDLATYIARKVDVETGRRRRLKNTDKIEYELIPWSRSGVWDVVRQTLLLDGISARDDLETLDEEAFTMAQQIVDSLFPELLVIERKKIPCYRVGKCKATKKCPLSKKAMDGLREVCKDHNGVVDCDLFPDNKED